MKIQLLEFVECSECSARGNFIELNTYVRKKLDLKSFIHASILGN